MTIRTHNRCNLNTLHKDRIVSFQHVVTYFSNIHTANQTHNTKVLNEANGVKAPKPKVPKAKKVVKGASDSDSANELEIEDEPPERTPAILTVSAPPDARSQALFGAVEAVWSPRNKPVTPEKIRSGIHQFGETVRKLRDVWKAKNDALIKAELPSSDTATDAPKLKDEVAHYRQVMELVMSRSLDYGNDSIVKRYVPTSFPSPPLRVIRSHVRAVCCSFSCHSKSMKAREQLHRVRVGTFVSLDYSNGLSKQRRLGILLLYLRFYGLNLLYRYDHRYHASKSHCQNTSSQILLIMFID